MSYQAQHRERMLNCSASLAMSKVRVQRSGINTIKYQGKALPGNLDIKRCQPCILYKYLKVTFTVYILVIPTRFHTLANNEDPDECSIFIWVYTVYIDKNNFQDRNTIIII